MSLIQTTLQPINRCVNNDGQIPDVPKNPRQINETEFEELKESIRSFPKMLELRECVAYEYDNQLVVLGGNMRLRACKDLGMKEIPVKVIPADTDAKQLREFAIKDNVSKGKMDWDIFHNEWDSEEGEEWGVKDWTSGEDINLDDFFEEDAPASKEETFKIILEYTKDDFDKVSEAFKLHEGTKEQILFNLLEISVN